MAGMKALRLVGSPLLSLVLLMMGAFAKHPGECFDCFQPHGFPFTYRQDRGYGGGAAFYPWRFAGDLFVFAGLTVLIYLLWSQRSKQKDLT